MNRMTLAAGALAVIVSVATAMAQGDGPKYPAPSSPGAALAIEPEGAKKSEPAKPAAFRAPVAVNRRDMAAAYLALERALRDVPPAGERVSQVNKEFDALTMLFFSGNFSEAIKRVEAMRVGVLGIKPSDDEALLASLKVSASPETIERNKAASVTVRITSLYPVEKREARTLRVVVLGASRALGKENSPSVELVPDAGGAIDASVKIDGPWSDVVAGSVKLRLIAGDASRDVDAGLVAIDGSLEASKRAMLARLDAIKDEKLRASVRAVRSRVELISDKRSSANSAQFLSDPVTIMGEAEHEIALLETGQNPFVHRMNGYWRVFGVEEPLIAARVYVPVRDHGGGPRPVVIALHGAGGDESMFVEGYGAGKLVELAREWDFIVVSPRTEQVATRGDALDLILDELGACYAIDRSRVYVIGHSMGAMAAASAASRHADKLAGVVCIAGGPSRVPEGKIAPTLLMAAELDPIFPPRRLEQGAKVARERGLPVEVQVVPNFGHTLVVGARLPQAVEWLMGKRLAE